LQEFSKWSNKNSALMDLAENKERDINSGKFQVSLDAELGIWWCLSNSE